MTFVVWFSLVCKYFANATANAMTSINANTATILLLIVDCGWAVCPWYLERLVMITSLRVKAVQNEVTDTEVCGIE